MFVITIDTDWAIQPLIDDTVQLLEQYKINSTFFITNKIDFSKLKKHELAIHPYFKTVLSQEKVLRKTLEILPSKKSKGIRSHTLYNNSNLIGSYKKYGIEYDSNFFIPNAKEPKPFFFEWTNVLEIPIFFIDNGYVFTNNKFILNKINLTNNGVKVFCFHPFHIFMNTSSNKEYNNLKKNYKNFEHLSTKRQLTKKGVRSLFIELLEFI